MQSDDSLNLIRNAVSGDMESYTELMRKNYPMLHRIIACRIDKSYDRDDVMQDVLLTAWLNIGRLRKAESFKSWIIRITTNSCNKWYRMKGRVEEPVVETRLFHMIDRNVPVFSEKEYDLADKLNELPKDQKSALMDFYFHDLKISEISFSRNIPEGTVKRRLHDGRKNLKKRLEEDYE